MSEAVNTSQRTTKNRRCPICGGAAGDQRGRQRRCYGFTSSDGKYVHCTREEHAGALPLISNSNTYAHRLGGKCDCGTTHGTDERDWNNIEVAYDYRDERGSLLYQVVRKIPKDFLQRRPDGVGGWVWSIGDTRRVLYRLPQLLSAPVDQLVFVVEGEKDVERLRERAIATCNPGGARKWNLADDCARKALRGRHIVIIADADRDGRAHAEIVKDWARSTAATIRVLDLAPSRDDGYDLSDWLDEQHTIDELKQIAEGTEAIETGIEADPWQAELEAALVDVRNALVAPRQASDRPPLFGAAADLFEREYPPTVWLVNGLVTRGGTTQLGAEPKSCKTWLASELAVAIATGTPVCGEFGVVIGVVAYFFAEDLAIQVRNRLRALLAARELSPESLGGRLHVCPRGRFLDITRDEDLAWVVASCRRLGSIDLLVLDPLRDIHSAKENESDEMSPVMRRLRLLGELLGCTVAFAHHASKPTKETARRRPGQRSRGSGAIYGSTDNGVYFGLRDGNGVSQFELEVDVEIKGARSAGSFSLALDLEDDEDGGARKATWKVVREAKAKAKAVSKAKAEAADERAMIDFVRTLATRGEGLSRRALREHDECPIPDRRAREALDRLKDAGQIVLYGAVVRLPESGQGDRS